MTSLRLLQLLLLLGAVSYVQAASLCFFPNGRQSKDVPCDPTAEVSMCCGSVAACLSNGLCKDESTTNSTGVAYARGTCSDPTWQSPFCPQNCQLNQDTMRNRSAYDFRANGVQVWECDAQGFGQPARYCCESAAEKTRCCATSSALFRLASASPGNALPIQTYPPPVSSFATRSATPGTTGIPKPTAIPDASRSSMQAPAPTPAPVAAPLSSSTDAAGAKPTNVKVPASPALDTNGIATGPGGEQMMDMSMYRSSMTAMGVGAGIGGAALSAMLVMLVIHCLRRRREAAMVETGQGTFRVLSGGRRPSDRGGTGFRVLSHGRSPSQQWLVRPNMSELGSGHSRHSSCSSHSGILRNGSYCSQNNGHHGQEAVDRGFGPGTCGGAGGGYGSVAAYSTVVPGAAAPVNPQQAIFERGVQQPGFAVAGHPPGSVDPHRAAAAAAGAAGSPPMWNGINYGGRFNEMRAMDERTIAAIDTMIAAGGTDGSPNLSETSGVSGSLADSPIGVGQMLVGELPLRRLQPPLPIAMKRKTPLAELPDTQTRQYW
ncbi:hypothetical protein RB595_001397 [Gaeumannomyces hyphopodioides]